MAIAVVIPHRFRPEAAELANGVIKWLQNAGHEIRIPDGDNVHHNLLGATVLADDVALKGADLAISIGGDGTMLRAINLASREGVPVLGVNAGHLGYLTAVPASESIWALEQFFSGEHKIEERMTINVSIKSETVETKERIVFNEVVVEKTISGHTIDVGLHIGGRPFLTYAADGMIIATPSGSTAYNLSARGPIVSPHMRAIVITPVSPHMLFDRSLVVIPEEFVELEILDDLRANLVVDGTLLGQLMPGDSVKCTEGKYSARLVVFGSRDVHSVLRDKFGLSDR